MRREVPTWLAGLIILVVLIVIGLVYWIFVPKPQPGGEGKPIIKPPPGMLPPGMPGVGKPMQPSPPEKGK